MLTAPQMVGLSCLTLCCCSLLCVVMLSPFHSFSHSVALRAGRLRGNFSSVDPLGVLTINNCAAGVSHDESVGKPRRNGL